MLFLAIKQSENFFYISNYSGRVYCYFQLQKKKDFFEEKLFESCVVHNFGDYTRIALWPPLVQTNGIS